MVAKGQADESLAEYAYLEDPASEVQAKRHQVAQALAELKAKAEAAKGTPLEGQLLNLTARANLILGQIEPAVEDAENALDISSQLQDKSVEAKAHLTVSRVRLKQGDFEASMQAVREAVAIFQETGEGRKEAEAYYALAGVCMEQGSLSEGHQAADKAQALWANEGDTKEEIKSMLRLSEIVAMRGQLEEAVEIAEEAMVSAQKRQNREAEALAVRTLSLFHRETGDLDLALDAARKERLILEKAKDKQGAAQALLNIAAIHLGRDESKEASRAAGAAKTIFKKLKDPYGQVQSLSLIAQAHMTNVEQMDEDKEVPDGALKETKLNTAATRAYMATQEAMEIVKDCRDEVAIATANFSRAETLIMFAETREAVTCGRRAAEGFKRLGDDNSSAQALLLTAKGYQELSTPGLAEKAAEEALQLFEKTEDQEGAAAANELLNEIGPSGMAMGGGGGGANNYDIAEVAAPAAGAESAVAAMKKEPAMDRETVKQMVHKEVEMITGGGDDVEDDTPLMESGIDSLSSVQFRNDLTRDFNVKLPASLMFDYPTISTLTDKIMQTLEDRDA